MKLASSLDRLGTESAFSVLAEAKKLEAAGNPMIHLGLGQYEDSCDTSYTDAFGWSLPWQRPSLRV